MSREEFQAALERHADELERAIALCTTRIEHVRVSSAAGEARRLADAFRAAGAPTAA